MRHLSMMILFCGFVQSAVSAPLSTFALRLQSREGAAIEKMNLKLGSDWTLAQEARDGQTMLFGFTHNSAYLTFYVKPGTGLDMKSVFANNVETLNSHQSISKNSISWQTMLNVKHLPAYKFGPAENNFVYAFATEIGGNSYYGYARGASEQEVTEVGQAFLSHLTLSHATRTDRSLTGPDYTGKKYYFGWGSAGSGAPSEMVNEVKYDVLHTSNIFTQDVGGNYIGSQLVGASTVTGTAIKKVWDDLYSKMTWNDMYVQYSSGHGDSNGLMVGVSHNEIRDNALRYPAKEMIIFTMACESGGLIDSFNAKKSVWQNWQTDGRTLFVFASSQTSELSSTGPGTDVDESAGVDGSAGSAFGYALWKSLIGYADGEVDGVKDGFLAIGEIESYTKRKALEVGDQHPVSTGAYNANLIMNKVPPKSFVDSLDVTSEGLTDAQVMDRIQKLDAEYRIR